MEFDNNMYGETPDDFKQLIERSLKMDECVDIKRKENAVSSKKINKLKTIWSSKTRSAKARTTVMASVCVLLLAGAAFAAMLWPEHITSTFHREDAMKTTKSALTMLDMYGGNEILASSSYDDTELTVHYIITDGHEVSVFFSLKGLNGPLPPVEELYLWAGLYTADYEASNYGPPDIQKGENDSIIYGMFTTTLLDGQNQPISVANHELTFEVVTEERERPIFDMISEITPEAIAAINIERNLASDESNASELIIHGIRIDGQTLHVDYTLHQADDSEDSIANKAYLVVCGDTDAVSSIPVNNGYEIRNGHSTLTTKYHPGDKLYLVSDRSTIFNKTDPSWQLTLTVPGIEDPMVRDVVLDKAIAYDDVTINVNNAVIRPTGIDLHMVFQYTEGVDVENLKRNNDIHDIIYDMTFMFTEGESLILLDRTSVDVSSTLSDGPEGTADVYYVHYKFSGRVPEQQALTASLFFKDNDAIDTIVIP